MDKTGITFYGRVFSEEDIEMIKWTRKTYPKLSRTELASTVCELIDWTTPAGQPKQAQCAELLKKLEEENIIKLPPVKKQKKRECRVNRKEYNFNTTEQKGELRDYEPIKLEIARPGECLRRWRAYVNQYHILGDKWVFGSRLQYYIKSGETELGCLQFSASAWALEQRDKWIGWTVEDKKARLHLILNNSRFLIFPWVHIKNLESKTLSIAVKQIKTDWVFEYCYEPVLLETFVDVEKYEGISYKASNWIYLGETKGRGRMDRKMEYGLSKKAIYVYPLTKDFRAYLKGERSYKVVTPDAWG